MKNKSLENIVVKHSDGVETVFDLSGIAEEKHPKIEKCFKGCGFDLLNWDNKDLAKILDYFDESTNRHDFLCFWFKEKGEEKSALLHKGNYHDVDCAYYIRIGKDVDLFSSKDEVMDFLEHLSKHK